MFLVLLSFSYMANGVWSFVRAMFRSAKEIPHEVVSAGSKKDLTSTVSQLDPAFDYECFEAKTLSLARIVAFEDDLASCPQYAGPPLDERLSRLVAMRYRGSIALDGIGVVGEDLVVDMRVFVEGTFDEGDIRVRNETLHLRMSHQAAFPVDPTFTITAVTCDGCGSGFDATRSRTCRTCAPLRSATARLDGHVAPGRVNARFGLGRRSIGARRHETFFSWAGIAIVSRYRWRPCGRPLDKPWHEIPRYRHRKIGKNMRKALTLAAFVLAITVAGCSADPTQSADAASSRTSANHEANSSGERSASSPSAVQVPSAQGPSRDSEHDVDGASSASSPGPRAATGRGTQGATTRPQSGTTGQVPGAQQTPGAAAQTRTPASHLEASSRASNPAAWPETSTQAPTAPVQTEAPAPEPAPSADRGTSDHEGAAPGPASTSGSEVGSVPAPAAPQSTPAAPAAPVPAPPATAPQATRACQPILASGTTLSVTDSSIGAVGDGRADDTAAIQRAIDRVSNSGGGTVEIPGGTYMINPIAVESVHGLMMRDNVTLKLADDAVLRALPTDKAHHSLISFIKVKNANLVGGTLIGERYQHTGQEGEWGHGVNIQSSQIIRVQNVTSKDFWGDGFYIGQAWQVWDSRSDQVELCSVTSVNNRRQGLSIVDGTNIRVLNSTFSHTNGIAPQAGLDIEPEDGNLVENVEVRNSVFEGNLGDGIVLTWGEQNNAHIKAVLLEGNHVLNNKTGIMLHRAWDCQVLNNTIRNAGNQVNMYYPMTLHLFPGASGNTVSGNVHIGGKTVDAGSGNTVSDAATKAGTYVRGGPTVGQTVSAEVLDTDGVPGAVDYQWYANGSPISGATAPTLDLSDAQANKTITVSSTFTDLKGNSETSWSSGITVKRP